jgi:hypothetical protein
MPYSVSWNVFIPGTDSVVTIVSLSCSDNQPNILQLKYDMQNDKYNKHKRREIITLFQHIKRTNIAEIRNHHISSYFIGTIYNVVNPKQLLQNI